MITRNMDYYNLDMIINPIKSRIKQIFLIRATTSAERYCNEEQKYKIMKSYFSIKPGATFFLGSSQLLVYHKDDAIWGQETL
jgi:hypothetical protein